MEELLAARLQMAVSLGFHIVFACIGMTMPVFMAFSEWRWLRTGKQVYIDITKAWSKGVAIFLQWEPCREQYCLLNWDYYGRVSWSMPVQL